jgi:DNA repair exonuclease SbcCD ATPase subunit
MVLLNIFQHGDTTFAWDNLVILLLAVAAGYWICRYTLKRAENQKWRKTIEEAETKCKRVENEFKNYKANIGNTEKNNEKSVVGLSHRVKGLEGDIRVLSDEKNKYVHSMEEKEQENRRLGRLMNEIEDRFKMFREEKANSESNFESKLKASGEALSKAMIWEHRVRAAEEDAQKARAAINHAERKKLEAELRLKATADFAGRVVPMETELKTIKEKYVALQSELELARNTVLDRDITKAQLELSKQNNFTLQMELEAKHATHVSLIAELDLLKSEIKKIFDEKELRAAAGVSSFNGLAEPFVSGQVK